MAKQLNELVRLTATGLQGSTYEQIRGSLIDWYKSVFGSDIDLKSGTADGTFVEELSLLIFNLNAAISNLYSEMNISTASGKNLDNLVRLSNISRLTASNSKVSLLVKNTTDQTITTSDMMFEGQDETIWIARGDFTFEANETKTIEAECETPGPVLAPAYSIKSTIQLSSFEVTQPSNAIPGRDDETDAELRSRFNNIQGAASRTVLEGLVSALLSISGIEDVKIYENNSQEAIRMQDGTNLLAHDIYVIIRTNEEVTIDTSIIGTILHNKLTPGIRTTQMTAGLASGDGKSYVYSSDVYGEQIVQTEENIYWKEAIPVSPKIEVIVTASDNYTSDVDTLISNAICKYMNELKIDTNLVNTNELVSVARSAVPQIKGSPAVRVNDVLIDGTHSYFTPNTYFKYNSITVTTSVAKTMQINNNLFGYDVGMTWAQWVASTYNTINATISDGFVKVGAATLKSFGTEVPIESTTKCSDFGRYFYTTAQTGYFYTSNIVGGIETGRNYQFEIGQTFTQWTATDYNPTGEGKLIIQNNHVTIDSGHGYLKLSDGIDYVEATATIVNGKTYYLWA